jgi:hypothetical protein
MLECRPMALSRFRIAVMVASQGALDWYMPNWTSHGATAAIAGWPVATDATLAIERARALFKHA